MKKLCIILGLMLAAHSISLADSGVSLVSDNTAAIAARATKLSRAMANTMQLDEGQYLKVKQLNVRMLTEVDGIKSRYAADRDILDEQLADAQQRYESELTNLLRPRQVAVFREAQNNMTALSIMAN